MRKKCIVTYSLIASTVGFSNFNIVSAMQTFDPINSFLNDPKNDPYKRLNDSSKNSLGDLDARCRFLKFMLIISWARNPSFILKVNSREVNRKVLNFSLREVIGDGTLSEKDEMFILCDAVAEGLPKNIASMTLTWPEKYDDKYSYYNAIEFSYHALSYPCFSAYLRSPVDPFQLEEQKNIFKRNLNPSWLISLKNCFMAYYMVYGENSIFQTKSERAAEEDVKKMVEIFAEIWANGRLREGPIYRYLVKSTPHFKRILRVLQKVCSGYFICDYLLDDPTNSICVSSKGENLEVAS